MFDKLLELIQWGFEALVPFVILQPFERGVLLRLGHFKKVVDPGFHWCLPLHMDLILYQNVTPRTTNISGLSTTQDGKTVGFSAIITWEIVDIAVATLEVDDVRDAITDACAGQIGTLIAEETWESLYAGRALGKLESACRRRGKKWGLNIREVQMAGVSLVKNIHLSNTGSHNATDSLHMR